jgi:hypothetical protein
LHETNAGLLLLALQTSGDCHTNPLIHLQYRFHDGV